MTTQATSAVAQRRPSTRPLAFALLGVMVAAMWILEGIDTMLGGRLDSEGVHPRDLEGLWGILMAPLLHGGWPHLIGNTIPLLVVGGVIALSGAGTWLSVTAIGWLLSGVVSWLLGGPNSVHIGASGVVFAYICFVIVRGFFSRKFVHLLVGVLAAAYYGLGVFAGVLPWGNDGISWQSHLGGAAGGVVAASSLSAGRAGKSGKSGKTRGAVGSGVGSGLGSGPRR